jgi:hypothetical protein
MKMRNILVGICIATFFLTVLIFLFEARNRAMVAVVLSEAESRYYASTESNYTGNELAVLAQIRRRFYRDQRNIVKSLYYISTKSHDDKSCPIFVIKSRSLFCDGGVVLRDGQVFLATSNSVDELLKLKLGTNEISALIPIMGVMGDEP